jgi:hypothetical protein
MVMNPLEELDDEPVELEVPVLLAPPPLPLLLLDELFVPVADPPT